MALQKKTWFWIVIVAVVVVLGLLYFHYTPIWASLMSIISGAAGIVVGWVGHIFYKKYVKPDAEIEADHA